MKKSTALAVLAVALVARGDPTPQTVGDEMQSLPLALPERPFLLVDAPRRFLPTESASVTLRLRDGGDATLAVYRVGDPETVVGTNLAGRQGVSIAQGPLGDEAEELLRPGAPPPPGKRLTLLKTVRARLDHVVAPRRVGDETQVSDSNESEEQGVTTYWMQSEGWAGRSVPLGPLPDGVYLVRAQRAAWASTAILSVGRLVLLARRGDAHDTVLVTGPDGEPQAGQEIESRDGGRVSARARTDAEGIARFAASDAPSRRFVVRRGEDVAWADVAHARLDPCDPVVYLGIGRPLYRPGETVHVRGHVQGCGRDGRYGPLGGETVRIGPTSAAGGTTEVRTDDRGDFVAQLVAGSDGIRAHVRGREHGRPVRIDTRGLPRHALTIEFNRPWAAAGDLVRVRVADDDGGWPEPREVVLETPAGRLLGRIGPRSPALLDFVVPGASGPLRQATVSASVADAGTITMAAASLWIGDAPATVEIESARTLGSTGEDFDVTVRAADLGGLPIEGPAELALYATESGNRRRGSPLWNASVGLSGGAARAVVPLRGPGPWIVEARAGGARGEMVLWERARPPSLSARGPLAVEPATRTIQAGRRLAATLRLPAGPGRAWVTLEQGSVWQSRLVEPARQGPTVVDIEVPDRARGRASLVIAHVASGRVTTATATVDVASSLPFGLTVRTDRLRYAEGAHARVTVEAKTPEGQPRDAVVSLWLADAGYWDLGADDYPLPTEYLRLTGRMASAADSTAPIGYGSEEGRVLPDALLEWNGRVLPRASYRHAWGAGGEIVSVEVRGRLQEVATALARAAGRARAVVCARVARALGTVSLRARRLPWDLVAARVAEATGTEALANATTLRFDCPEAAAGEGRGAGGLGMRRHGSGGGGAVGGRVQQQRLEGTLFFLGLRPLGPTGRAELDVPLPAQPGRWRIEVLAIAEDGGGDQKGVSVRTERAIEAWLDLPVALRPGDEAEAEVQIAAAALAGRAVDVAIDLPPIVAFAETPPRRLILDARGRASTTLRVRATSPGRADAVLRVAHAAVRAAVAASVVVLPPATRQSLSLRAFVGAAPTDVYLPMPELAAPAEIEVSFDADLAASIADVLERLLEPRWNLPALRVDRLASLVALRDPVDSLARAAERPALDDLAERIRRAIQSETVALESLRAPDGGLAWWRRMPHSERLTAEALRALGSSANGPAWREAWDAVRASVRGANADRATSALEAYLLSRTRREPEDARLAKVALDRAGGAAGADVETLGWTALAARALSERPSADASTTALLAALQARAAPVPSGAGARCRGPVWFLCFARWGDDASLARAARALLDLSPRDPRAREVAAAVAQRLAGKGPVESSWHWGTGEADTLALVATLAASAPEADRLRVDVDGRPVDLRDGRLRVPAGAQEVGVHVAARAGRFRQIRVYAPGGLSVVPPTRPRGSVEVVRRFEGTGTLRTLIVQTDLPARARDLEIAVPLPAGLTLGASAAAPAGATLAIVDGEARLYWADPPAAVRLRLPMTAIAVGRFEAGPLRLSARGAAGRSEPVTAIWALVPATTVAVTR